MNTTLIYSLLCAAAILFLGAILYVAFSKSKLATNIRNLIRYGEMRAGEATSSIDANMANAEAKSKAGHQDGRQSLNLIDRKIHELKLKLAAKMAEIEADNRALKLAKQEGNKPAFDSLVEELDSDQDDYEQIEDDLESAVQERLSLEGLVDDLGRDARMMERERRRLSIQETVDDIKIAAHEAKSGLSKKDTGRADFESAKLLAETKRARANAAAQASEGLTAEEKSRNEAEKFIKKAGQRTRTNADDLWAQMDEKSSESDAK